MSTFAGWEAGVLSAIGAPITAANVAFLDSWQALEGGSASNNPLNTTQPAAGASAYNSVGVQNYATPEQGIAATAQTLQNGYYPNILAALKSGNPFASAGLANDLSTWSGGGYTSVPVPAGLTSASQGSTVAASTPGGTMGVPSWWQTASGALAGFGGAVVGGAIGGPAVAVATSTAATQAASTTSGPFAFITAAITSAAQNAGLLAIALAFVAGGFAWLAAPTIKEYAPKVAEAAAAG